MRFLALGLAILAASCVTTPKRHVFVPKTPEAAKCWRECKAIATACQGPTPGYRNKNYISEVYGDVDDACEDQRKDCLLTCPGAYETTPKE